MTRQLKIGDKVWFQSRNFGRVPAIIEDFGEKDGRKVVGLAIEGKTGDSASAWGYINQVQPR